MAKKQLKVDPFGSGESPTTYSDTLGSLVGLEGLDNLPRNVTATPVSIFKIVPDPLQPRHIFPGSVRSMWDSRPETIRAMLEEWHKLVEEERKGALDLTPFFENPESVVSVPTSDEDVFFAGVGPIERGYLKVVHLAGSILTNGLINPITTVKKRENVYQIDSGERRWLAYHLLYYFFNESNEWEKIPAREVPEPSPWRQADENGARDDLTAIARARQFAILLMDVLKKLEGEKYQFREPSASELAGNDRSYYAQVSDGSVYRVPRGVGPKLLGTLGLQTDDQLRKYRALLRLPDRAWQLADDYGLPEKSLRALTAEFVPDDEKIAMVEQLILDGNYTVSQDTESIVGRSGVSPSAKEPTDSLHSDSAVADTKDANNTQPKGRKSKGSRNDWGNQERWEYFEKSLNTIDKVVLKADQDTRNRIAQALEERAAKYRSADS